MNYNLNNFGTWEILDDGSKLWRAEIHSLGAFSIGIEYDYFHLPEGAEFYVYSADKFMVHGAYSHINNQKDYLFATPLVKGDRIIWIIVFALSLLSIMVVYSAAGWTDLTSHIVKLFIGLVAMYVVHLIPF